MKKTLWVLLYIAVFIGSAVLFGPMIYKARGADESSRVKWNDSVGTIMTDFSYGEKPANKFDLYLPADMSRDHYGLVGYFHGGGFHGGDKEGDSGILKWLASKGYDVQFGARPLKRLIQSAVEDPFCQLILEDKVKPGQTIVASATDSHAKELTLEVQ